MNWRIRKMPKPLTAPGMIRPANELSQPSPRTMTNSGIMMAWKGTIIAASTTTKSTRRPGKRNLANPYPARAEESSVVPLTATATMVLLRKYTSNGADDSAAGTFCQCSPMGIQRMGWAKMSAHPYRVGGCLVERRGQQPQQRQREERGAQRDDHVRGDAREDGADQGHRRAARTYTSASSRLISSTSNEIAPEYPMSPPTIAVL